MKCVECNADVTRGIICAYCLAVEATARAMFSYHASMEGTREFLRQCQKWSSADECRQWAKEKESRQLKLWATRLHSLTTGLVGNAVGVWKRGLAQATTAARSAEQAAPTLEDATEPQETWKEQLRSS